MADKIKLQVNKRKITGRKVKTLRREGIIPANIYGKDVKSLAIQLPVKEFHKAFKVAGETNIIELKIDKDAKVRSVLVNNIHRHPVTDYYLHIDFHQVDLTKKVTVNIPVELKGDAPAVSKGGVLIHQINEVEVEALPTDLPDQFTLDISKLEDIGQSLTLKDLKVDTKKVTIVAENLDEVVVQVEEPKKEEEVVPETEEVAEGEEGETPAEDEEGDATTKGDAKDGEAKDGDKQGKKEEATPKEAKS